LLIQHKELLLLLIESLIILTRGALFALNLELGDLAGVIDVEVLKDGLGSLLVLVADLLGLGVDLLLSLLLTTVEGKADVDG